MNQEKIGQFIKDLRKKNNLTQEEFAKEFGVTYQAVSKWENGKNIPDIAILKEMSKKFNFDLNDLLEGNQKKKKIYLLILILIIFFLGMLLLLVKIINYNNNFEFKTITTTCTDFEITGSAAYNKDKSSIFISNVTYCGKEDSTKYKQIDCNLYESYDKNQILISSCKSMKNISLIDYLKEVKINVDNYNASCKRFSASNLYLEIEATDENNKISVYKIPISLADNC